MATKTDTNVTWTDADAQALADLTAKKAAAEKAALAPVLTALGTANDVSARITALQSVRPKVSAENQLRIDRIIINMQVDVLGLLADGGSVTSAQTAVGSASTATTQAINAATSAGNASTSATNASA